MVATERTAAVLAAVRGGRGRLVELGMTGERVERAPARAFGCTTAAAFWIGRPHAQM
ncbi:unnamed protein product [Ectocarpus sp. CCAP 1310/34]|nr:unnamed protein product [Ectocarpus sp. CCAP 1310/34]